MRRDLVTVAALAFVFLGSGCGIVSVYPATPFDRGRAYGTLPSAARDDGRLIEQYRRDAELGDPKAQGLLGLSYQFGLGVPQNDTLAFLWCRRAAEAGSAPAQYHLGTLYLKGRGVPRDIEAAATWFRRAAEQDPWRPQVHLGLLYLDLGAPAEDMAEATQWFTQAANAGIALGSYALELVRRKADEQEMAAGPPCRAREHCRRRAVTLPSEPFSTDGCSLWPDGPWRACCVEHDIAYWCGGEASERARADDALQRCVADVGYPAVGQLMYWGVRVGGHPWLPLPWRWGYGRL